MAYVCWQRLQFLVTGLDVVHDCANELLGISDAPRDFPPAQRLLFLALLHRLGDIVEITLQFQQLLGHLGTLHQDPDQQDDAQQDKENVQAHDGSVQPAGGLGRVRERPGPGWDLFLG